MSDRITDTDLMHTGGQWLGRVRGWIQVRFRNGETVTWGSQDRLLNAGGQLTVYELEWLAARIAADAINEDREKFNREFARRRAP